MIICLSGWKASGKDTVANYLVKYHGFVRIAFADLLKDMVSEEYEVPREWFDLQEMKEMPLYKYPAVSTDKFVEQIHSMLKEQFRPGLTGGLYWTPRALAILEGSIKRSVNPNYWVERAMSQTSPEGRYVISDVRYQNEINQIRLIAPGEVISVRIERFETVDTNDPSERDLDKYPFDYKVNNSFLQGITFEQVYNQVEGIIKSEQSRLKSKNIVQGG